MERRDFLVGLGAAGLVGAGGYAAYTTGGSTDATGVESVELRRFDAPGSPPGTETVPQRGQVTFLEMFATWCTICERKMSELTAAHEAVGDGVQFVSVTSEPVGRSVEPEDVVEWFSSLGGSWPLAHDEELELSRRVDATAVPYAVVFDEQNRIVSSSTGFANAETLVERIESA